MPERCPSAPRTAAAIEPCVSLGGKGVPMKSRKILVVATVFAWAALGVATSSHAAQVMQSGASCQPIDETTTVRYHAPYVSNPFSGWRSVVCPVAHALPEAAGALFSVYWNDQNASSDIQCTLYRTTSSGTVDWWQTKTSAGTGTGVQTWGVGGSVSSPTLSLVCSLPPNGVGASRINQYSSN